MKEWFLLWVMGFLKSRLPRFGIKGVAVKRIMIFKKTGGRWKRSRGTRKYKSGSDELFQYRFEDVNSGLCSLLSKTVNTPSVVTQGVHGFFNFSGKTAPQVYTPMGHVGYDFWCDECKTSTISTEQSIPVCRVCGEILMPGLFLDGMDLMDHHRVSLGREMQNAQHAIMAADVVVFLGANYILADLRRFIRKKQKMFYLGENFEWWRYTNNLDINFMEVWHIDGRPNDICNLLAYTYDTLFTVGTVFTGFRQHNEFKDADEVLLFKKLGLNAHEKDEPVPKKEKVWNKVPRLPKAIREKPEVFAMFVPSGSASRCGALRMELARIELESMRKNTKPTDKTVKLERSDSGGKQSKTDLEPQRVKRPYRKRKFSGEIRQSKRQIKRTKKLKESSSDDSLGGILDRAADGHNEGRPKRSSRQRTKPRFEIEPPRQKRPYKKRGRIGRPPKRASTRRAASVKYASSSDDSSESARKPGKAKKRSLSDSDPDEIDIVDALANMGSLMTM
eukprot:CAMPEP_0203801720 /NCGR_PEP_ID=MMETSP0100_2-20121128/11530_1 /ASSEMBLY_ACC=CAM_ASM_000210 /TAXON_ID=96639 /ORGANISM=" , Strain NY0313808BC1" /LENGTH=503 /DNA_ID=CAMNT_0050708547 /DNA_START=149 /DNA_END=1660 /DNA_ORIENTATION=-